MNSIAIGYPQTSPAPQAYTQQNLHKKVTSKAFYDYMHLNPIVLGAIERVTGRNFINPPLACIGIYPELSAFEADDVYRLLPSVLPRQPHCPVKARFADVSPAYCAGVIDGEGHISAVTFQHPNRRYPGYRLTTSISQNHYLMLEAVQNCLGANGTIYSVARSIVQNRQCYDLKYDGIHAIAALATVYPYLIRKKELAIMLLKMYADGRIWEHVGARGVAPVIRERRAKIHRKFKRMH